MFSKNNNLNKRFLIETIIVIIFVGLFVNILYKHYNSMELKAKILSCKMDRKNLNFAVKIFKVRYGRLPKYLYELKEKNLLTIKSTPIISNKSSFKNKQLIDPFGNPYIYDNLTGKIFFSDNTTKLINQM